MRFSVIVPVYNVEKYLETCVRSVLSQSYQDFEMILVDDGSSDRCGDICDELAERSDRAIVVHKTNGGLSSARNAGLDIARGEYVIFLDSDDYWDDPVALENIDKQLRETNADVLLFSAKRFFEDSGTFSEVLDIRIEREKVCDRSPYAAAQYMIENNIYKACACNKVARRSLIEAHRMRFQEGRLSEDMDWCGNLLLYAKRFDYYQRSLYVYRQQRAGSITSGRSAKLLADKIYMCSQGYKQAKALNDAKWAELLASYYAYEYAVALGISGKIKDRALLKELRALSPLLTYEKSNKVKRVNRLKKYAGYHLTRRALYFYICVKR